MKRKRIVIIIGAIVAIPVVLFTGMLVLGAIVGPQPSQGEIPTQPTHIAAMPTMQPTMVPTARPTVAPTATSQPVVVPTTRATAVPTRGVPVVVRKPQLGGLVSDFYAKYGNQLFGVGVQNGTTPSGAPGGSVAWLDGGTLVTVDYYTPSNVVYSVNGSLADWSVKQYQDYLMVFAPDGYEVNGQAPNTPDLIAYNSPVGKFFLHLDQGSGYINLV